VYNLQHSISRKSYDDYTKAKSEFGVATDKTSTAGNKKAEVDGKRKRLYISDKR
jgi:hypothetical protein